MRLGQNYSRAAKKGAECELEELRDRFYRYISERYEALLSHFDRHAPQTIYLVARTGGNDPHIDFIFTDKTALQRVRLRHFMHDCRAIAEDDRDLEPLIAQERQAVLTYLDQAYQDILAHFDPKLVKFRKKRQIVIADGAIQDLMHCIDSEPQD